MKFTINKQAFLNELNNVNRAVPGKATIPVLTGIKLTASQDHLSLIGSDGSISIVSLITADSETNQLDIFETGSVVIMARLFIEIIRKLPTDTVSIETKNLNIVNIQSGNAEFNLNGTPGDSYPQLKEFDLDHQITLPTASFKQLIDQTIFSASNQETRPILTGLHLIASSNSLTGITTDSHRLSYRQIPLEIDSNLSNFDALTIPKKTVSELSRILNDEDDLYMVVADTQVIFLVNNLTIYSSILEGNYPATDRLISNEFNTELIVNANAFYHAIDRAALLAHQGQNNAVQLSISEGNVELAVAGNESGQASEAIIYQDLSGEDITISFNAEYMKEALAAFGDSEVKVHFQSPIRAIQVIAAQEDHNNKLLQLITPIRTHRI